MICYDLRPDKSDKSHIFTQGPHHRCDVVADLLGYAALRVVVSGGDYPTQGCVMLFNMSFFCCTFSPSC